MQFYILSIIKLEVVTGRSPPTLHHSQCLRVVHTLVVLHQWLS